MNHKAPASRKIEMLQDFLKSDISRVEREAAERKLEKIKLSQARHGFFRQHKGVLSAITTPKSKRRSGLRSKRLSARSKRMQSPKQGKGSLVGAPQLPGRVSVPESVPLPLRDPAAGELNGSR